MRKEKKYTSTTLIEENKKIIKYATIYCVLYSIIMIGLIIAFIYCKLKGI